MTVVGFYWQSKLVASYILHAIEFEKTEILETKLRLICSCYFLIFRLKWIWSCLKNDLKWEKSCNFCNLSLTLSSIQVLLHLGWVWPNGVWTFLKKIMFKNNVLQTNSFVLYHWMKIGWISFKTNILIIEKWLERMIHSMLSMWQFMQCYEFFIRNIIHDKVLTIQSIQNFWLRPFS